MLDYGWGNPSSIMLPVDETGEQPEPNRPVFDPYNAHGYSEAPAGFITSENHFPAGHHHLPFYHPSPNPSSNFPTMYDSRASYSASGSSYHPPAFMAVPKTEPTAEFNSRIGLNLGGRTYFASSEDDFVNRLYRRSRMLEPGSANSPRCQVEGCNADLSYAKHYHRRHKVCEFHSKSATVVAAGLTQRFCQQCSRFHLLSEFDNGKRSCRKRLADHNRRRRKSQQTNNHETAAGPTSSSQNLPRPPRDSSSVTVAISPPRISLDCFGSTASTNSLFYSNGD